MNNITDKTAVVIEVDEPTPVAFLNLFEKGDIWVKAKGCEDCPVENRRRCCNQCPLLIQETGQCMAHLGVGSLNKPFECVIRPIPDKCYSWCNLEYKCVQGSNEGKIRKVNEPPFGI